MQLLSPYICLSILSLTCALPFDRTNLNELSEEGSGYGWEVRDNQNIQTISVSNTNIDDFLDTTNIGYVPDVTEGPIINTEVIFQAPVVPTQVISSSNTVQPPISAAAQYINKMLYDKYINNRVDEENLEPEFCSAVDLLVLLDKTSSVNAVFENGVEFSRQLVDSLTLDGERLSQRFGLITFRYDSHRDFSRQRINFDDELPAINRTLDVLSQESPRGATCLPSALSFAKSVVERNLRRDVPMVIFVITDGHSNKCDMDHDGVDEFYSRQHFHAMTAGGIQALKEYDPNVYVYPVMIGQHDSEMPRQLAAVSDKVFHTSQVDEAVIQVHDKIRQLSCKLFARKSDGIDPLQVINQPIVRIDCAKADVLIILDKTGSTASDYTNGLTFASTIAQHMAISQEFQRLGLITFGYKMSQVLEQIPITSDFNDNRDALQNKLNDLQSYRYTFGKTCIATGMDYVLHTAIPNIQRDDDTPLFVFLVTDGVSNSCKDYSIEADRDLGRSAVESMARQIDSVQGVQFYPVAIGDNLPRNGLSLLSTIGHNGEYISATTPEIAVDLMREIVGRELKCF